MIRLFKNLLGFALGVALVAAPVSASAYTVEKGDTMGQIANEHNLSLSQIGNMNKQVEDIDLIFVGDEIKTDSKEPTPKADDPVKEVSKDISYSEEELLAHLVWAEAKDEPYDGMVAVAQVVFNRVNSDEFPNSIYNVIYQNGQFTPVSNGQIEIDPPKEAYDAVNDAMKGTVSVNGALFFYNPQTATSRWLDGKPTVKVIDDHVFKK